MLKKAHSLQKKNSSKKHSKKKSPSRKTSLFTHSKDSQKHSKDDYKNKLLSKNKYKHHFFEMLEKKTHSSSVSDADKKHFDALHEAIKLAQSVVRAQGSIPLRPTPLPFNQAQAVPISPLPSEKSPSDVVLEDDADKLKDSLKNDSQNADLNDEQKQILEEERLALQRERELLLEEKKYFLEMQQAMKSSPKKDKVKPISVSEDKPSNTEHLETKLRLLEERLKNAEFSESSKQKEFKNEVELEEIQFVREPVGDRAQTGIIGLDPVIQGGFRRLSTTLVAGGPGSGKTIFAMQYLINGIQQFNETGVYITFDKTKEELFALFSNFGFDLEALEKEKKLSILRFTPEQVSKIIDAGGGSLRDSIDAIHASRIVIDSISDLLMLYNGDMAKRRACVDLFDMFVKLKTTTLVVAEQEVNPLKHVSNVLEYQVDGVILLYNERAGDVRQRALEIFKMRGTKHAGRIFPMRITDTGIIINSAGVVKAQ